VRRLLFLLAVLAPFGCAPTTRVLDRLPEPEVRVEGMEVLSFDSERARVRLDLALENPGPPLTLDSARVSLLLQNRTFAEAAVALDGAEAPRGRSVITLPLLLAYLELPAAIERRLETGETIRLVARGLVLARRAGRPISIPFDALAETGSESVEEPPPEGPPAGELP